MPAPKTENLVARGQPMPAAPRGLIEDVKKHIEAVVDGIALPASLAVTQNLILVSIDSMVGFGRYEVQAADLRAAAEHLDEASAAHALLTAEGLDEFDRLIGEAHDRVCAALEAELPIHFLAPVGKA
jgi:hypothetical protein